MNTSIIKTLIRILNQKFLINARTLNGRYNFYNDLNLNFPEQMEMLYYVENEYGINFTDLEVQKLLTVRDLVDCIEKHISSETDNYPAFIPFPEVTQNYPFRMHQR